MSQLTDIIIKSGIVPANVLEEAKRWGLPTGNAEPPTDLQAEMTVEKFCEAIDEAAYRKRVDLTRETYLEVIRQYLDSMTPGVLHIKMEDDSVQKFSVHFGRNSAGEVITPWRSDDISDLLTNGETFLKVEREKIFFSNARELFYGDNKAFIVCMPSTKEPDVHRE